jgi:uncharacterized protein
MEYKIRMEKIADHVRAYQARMAASRQDRQFNPEYRWLHTLRVTQIGKQLAEAEGANVGHVVAACLLHDIAWFDDPVEYRDHGRLGARVARPLLAELGYDETEVNAICYAIAVHVDDKADFDHPHTLEADIVSDADNIDRFDAYRILLYCQPEIDDFKALTEKLAPRLETLRTYRQDQILGTESGNRLFNQRLDRQIEFFEAILAQDAISRMPDLD